MKDHKSSTVKRLSTRSSPCIVDVKSSACRKSIPESAVSSVRSSVRFSFEIEGHKVSDSQWQAIEAMADSVKIAYA